jgi:hypothetical protein
MVTTTTNWTHLDIILFMPWETPPWLSLIYWFFNFIWKHTLMMMTNDYCRKPCRAKEAVLSARNNQIINLTSSFPGSGCHEKVIYDYDFKSDTRNNLPPGLESIPSDSPLEKDTIPTLSNDTSLQSKTRESNPLNRNRAQDRATTVIFCKANRTFASQRERWWYIALANCDSRKGLRLKYRIVMTNDMTHGSWIKHFSADQLCKLNPWNWTGKKLHG